MELTQIHSKIHLLRNQRVILDFDLAGLYGVETRTLKQSVKRNMDRFPEDFMFQLTKEEWREVITICDNLPPNVKYIPTTPFAFTEQGIAMLSSVLRSPKAVQMNIAIMRAFVLLRQHLENYKGLVKKVKALENEMQLKFEDIYQAVSYLLKQDENDLPRERRKRIGF